ncbi:hypothetical protein YC2023_109374 [Brassica napus]
MRKVLTCNRFPLDKVACLCLLSFFPKRKELKIVRIQVERRKEGRIKSKKYGVHGDADAGNVVRQRIRETKEEEDSTLDEGFVDESKRLEPDHQNMKLQMDDSVRDHHGDSDAGNVVSQSIRETIQEHYTLREDDSKRLDSDHQNLKLGMDVNAGDPDTGNVASQNIRETKKEDDSTLREDNSKRLEPEQQKRGKYFFYDTPLAEETGVWIPVSVPPMLEPDHEEWSRGLSFNGGYFPEGEMGWNQILDEDKELTMWDVIVDMLLAARGKATALTSGNLESGISFFAGQHLLEQAWQEMAHTLTEANFGNAREILETEPPKWLPDSAASACMLCSVRFHPIMCSRHHCRYCGGLFCRDCSKGRSLLPVKFRVSDPQRVCDVCFVRLETVQPYLMDQVSPAAQLPTHDLTDLSTLRSWVNFPWGQSMEYEIYKATNTIRGYISKVGSSRTERSIPDAILRQAKGLAVITVARVGVMVTYRIGTGLVVARRDDGSWSPPSAISSFGLGWGAQVTQLVWCLLDVETMLVYLLIRTHLQAGGEFIDFIIVLRTREAIRTFGSNTHFVVGAGLSAAVGVTGRAVEADIRAGSGGYAACYTYSCSKGAFVGCSLEGSIFTTRTSENSRFYGSQSLAASDILLGSLPKPPAAAPLYRALGDLFQKMGR